jgi:hypothetical protein
MAAPGTITANANGTVKFTTIRGCMGCGNSVAVDQLDPAALTAYQAGRGAVQDLFPQLSASEREALMTGTHAECWDTVAGVPDEEGDDDACAYCEDEAEGQCGNCGQLLCRDHGTAGDGGWYCRAEC